MVWSGYTVLMSGRTDSIKINNNPGCLPRSTFVYSERAWFRNIFTNYGAELTAMLDSIMHKQRIKTKDEESMDHGSGCCEAVEVLALSVLCLVRLWYSTGDSKVYNITDTLIFLWNLGKHLEMD
ncbi:hypothetical protein Tco_1326904 [Tanacetum coccineum]